MTKENSPPKKPLSLGGSTTLELKKKLESNLLNTGAPAKRGGRGTVSVEVKKKRSLSIDTHAKSASEIIKQVVQTETTSTLQPPTKPEETLPPPAEPVVESDQTKTQLTEDEKANRVRVLQEALKRKDDNLSQSQKHEQDWQAIREAQQKILTETPGLETTSPAETADAQPTTVETSTDTLQPTSKPAAHHHVSHKFDDDEEEGLGKKKHLDVKKIMPVKRNDEPRRRSGKITITQALDEDLGEVRQRSLASVKRAREKERQKALQQSKPTEKIIRDVTIPEYITVQELANRMAERSVDVIKALMKMGVMATINHVLDADTAELIVSEFGHQMKRVTEADVEIGLEGDEDKPEDLLPRPPVITVMGHVDHGKTSLLDALRHTNVVSGEAGGITQHIGAYRIEVPEKGSLTFLDTPGHEAFTSMRARGAQVTDIVILVVAADDGVQPQTIEAIRHAKAAHVPIIVAINKIDKEGVDPSRVKTELLSHEVQVEDFGGDVLSVEISAKQRLNLDKLLEAIFLQAELLELKANPNRTAQGIIVEAQVETGRGPVASVLVQKGTLKIGDIFIAGDQWGRVRALIDEHGNKLEQAGPSQPVEVLGLQGAPSAGDLFQVVENETRAREITSYRQRKDKQDRALLGKTTLEQMFNQIKEGQAKELPVIIKGDVQGSVEAIIHALEKLKHEEVVVRVLHSAVGVINETDVSLAKASSGVILSFNVRATAQAKEMAKRDGVSIQYYSIIYDLINDVRDLLSGLLSPELKEEILGLAEIRNVFDITKVGKIAGCRVIEGVIRRNAKARLLRDHVVIHETTIASLRHIKDEVKEIKEGFECGIMLHNYQDIKEGDMIECVEVKEIARQI